MPIPVGRYTYRGEGEFKGLALQLRIEQDGRGVMVIKANTVLHLNEPLQPSPTTYAGQTRSRSNPQHPQNLQR